MSLFRKLLDVLFGKVRSQSATPTGTAKTSHAGARGSTDDLMTCFVDEQAPLIEGDLLSKQGEPRAAIAKYEEYIKKENDPALRSVAMIRIGKACLRLGDYEGAVRTFESGLGLLEEELRRGPPTFQGVPMPDTRAKMRIAIGDALHSIGATYQEWGQKTKSQAVAIKAVPYLERALKVAEETHQERLCGAILNSMGIVYRLFGDTQKATECYQQALAIAERTGDQALAHTTRTNLKTLRRLQ